ncbi:MAG: hypothetical protein ACI81V_001417 [Lentimonas sp.]|jgi:hypothetical protein
MYRPQWMGDCQPMGLGQINPLPTGVPPPNRSSLSLVRNQEKMTAEELDNHDDQDCNQQNLKEVLLVIPKKTDYPSKLQFSDGFAQTQQYWLQPANKAPHLLSHLCDIGTLAGFFPQDSPS